MGGSARHDTTLVNVGALTPAPEGAIDLTLVTLRRINVTGSLIGSIAQAQEVLDFCAERDIAVEVEVVPAEKINDALDKVVAKETRFRFVIDDETLPRSLQGEA